MVRYIWSHHAACERLPERSGLSIEEVEDRVDQHRYVLPRDHFGSIQQHHLIWDHVRECLISVPVVSEGPGNQVIPTILPVDYGSGYAEWQRAEAERLWRGPEAYYQESLPLEQEVLDWVTVTLSKMWIKPSGWPGHRDLVPLLSWPLREPEAAQSGTEGVVALFRVRLFCETVTTLLYEWELHIPNLVEGDIPILNIGKCGARRIVPLKFFLSAL